MSPPGPGTSRMRGPSTGDISSAPGPGLSSECSLSVLNLPPYRLAALSQVPMSRMVQMCIIVTC